MKMYRLIIGFWALALVLLGCNKTPKVEYIEVEAIPVSYIYLKYKVAEYLQKNGNKYETQAKWYAAQGKELVTTNPAKAIWNYKRAVTLFPHAQYYNKLSALLYAQDNFKEVSSCYSLLHEMSKEKGGKDYDFLPLTETELMNYVVYYFKGYGYYPFEVTDALRNGNMEHKSFRDKLISYEPLQTQVNTREFKAFLGSLLSDEELKQLDKSPEMFKYLLTKCTLVNQMSETKHTVMQFNFANSDATEAEYESPYEYMCYNSLKERSDLNHWCRIEPKEYMFLADSNVLLHYVVDTSYAGVTIDKRNTYHVLATFTAQGNPIDYLIVGKQCGNDLQEFNYNNNTLNIQKYKRVWRFGDDYNRFDNEVIKELNAGTSTYVLTTDARFKPQ